MTSLNKNIKKFRKESNVSQDKLSKLANVSLNTIVKLESGKSPDPTIETIQKISRALGVSVNDLLK